MADVATVSLSVTELRAAAKALRTLTAAPDDVQTSPVEQDAAVSALFTLLHAQLVDLGWRPQGLTLAPWAVESVARLLARLSAAAALPAPRGRAARVGVARALPQRATGTD